MLSFSSHESKEFASHSLWSTDVSITSRCGSIVSLPSALRRQVVKVGRGNSDTDPHHIFNISSPLQDSQWCCPKRMSSCAFLHVTWIVYTYYLKTFPSKNNQPSFRPFLHSQRQEGHNSKYCGLCTRWRSLLETDPFFLGKIQIMCLNVRVYPHILGYMHKFSWPNAHTRCFFSTGRKVTDLKKNVKSPGLPPPHDRKKSVSVWGPECDLYT